MIEGKNEWMRESIKKKKWMNEWGNEKNNWMNEWEREWIKNK